MTELTPRQTEIASLVARGLSDKVIAARTQLSIDTVREYIQAAAKRLPPGNGTPRYRLTLWFFSISSDEKTG